MSILHLIYFILGQKLIGGTSDGSIQIFFEKKIFSRPDIVIRPAHRIDTSIISLTVSSDGDLLASRGSTDETVFVWNLSKFSMATGNTNFKPILEMRGLPNDYPTANVEFSPDGKFICCGTTPLKKPARTGKYTATGTVTGPTTNNTDVTGESEHAGANTSSSSLLCFFDIHTAQQTYKLLSKSMTTSTSANGSGKGIGGTNTKSGQHIEYNSSTEPLVVEPCMTIGVIKDASVIAVKWQAKTNQIFCRYVTTTFLYTFCCVYRRLTDFILYVMLYYIYYVILYYIINSLNLLWLYIFTYIFISNLYHIYMYIVLYSTSFGLVRIFFDPRFSVKGALITSSRAPKRAKDPSDFAAVGEIINPHALPMYRVSSYIYVFLYMYI